MSAAPDFRVAIEVVDRASFALGALAKEFGRINSAVLVLNRQLMAVHDRAFGPVRTLKRRAPRPRDHHPHRRPHRARRLAARRLR